MPLESHSAILRRVAAGVICAIVTVVFSLSYATLIFSGPLSAWLAYGIATTFISATAGALVMVLRSSLPFALASTDSSTSAFTATVVAVFASRLLAKEPNGNLLGPILIILPF